MGQRLTAAMAARGGQRAPQLSSPRKPLGLAQTIERCVKGLLTQEPQQPHSRSRKTIKRLRVVHQQLLERLL